jgi:hypothetical protein
MKSTTAVSQQRSTATGVVLYPIDRSIDYRVWQRFLVAASCFAEASEKVSDFLHTDMSAASAANYGVVQINDEMDQLEGTQNTVWGNEAVHATTAVIERSMIDQIIQGKAARMHALLVKMADAPLKHRIELNEFVVALQAEIAGQHAALAGVIAKARPEGEDVSLPIEILAFQDALADIQSDHAGLIQALDNAIKCTRVDDETKYARFQGDLRWSIVDDLKGRLGAECANDVSGGEDEKDEAISVAETWIENNVSNQLAPTIIACAISLYGAAWAERKIRASLA